MSSLREHIARHERAEGSIPAEVNRLRDVTWAFTPTSQYRGALAQIAERDLNAILDAAPETVLAEVKAQALEEFAKLQDDITRAHDYAMDEDDWDEHRRVTASLRAGAARYRNGATHD